MENLNEFCKLNDIDFLVRGHQDYFANNVLFMGPNNGKIPNGINVDEIIAGQYNLQEHKKYFSNLESITNDFIKPVARLNIDDDNSTNLTFDIKPQQNNVETENTDGGATRHNNSTSNFNRHTLNIQRTHEGNNGDKPVQALTITTNTDFGRYLPKDSFIILSYSQ